MKMHVGLVVFAVAIGVARPAAAQMGAFRQDVRSACMGDYRRFCLGVMPGGGRILGCLSKHQPELSPACAAAIGTAVHCLEDFKRFCGNVQPRQGEARTCLVRHERQLSPACAKTLTRISNR